MSWNVRVIRTEPVVGGFTYDLHEVYYDDDGQPTAWTVNSVGPHGDTVDEVREYLVMCSSALSRAVLVERKVDDVDRPGHRIDVLVEEPLLNEVPEGYVGINDSGYLAIYTRGFSGPKQRIAKVVAVDDKWELREFKGHAIGKAHRVRLEAWVERL